MRKFGMWIAVGCLLAASAQAAYYTSSGRTTGTASQDLSQLQGTWRALKLQVGERSIEIPNRSKKNPGISLEVHGDHYEFHGMGATFKGRVRAAASTKDKRLEFVRDDGTTTTSAFRLEGASLKLTGMSATQNADDAEKGTEVWTFKREKP
jgi:hypothetical protein